ncbi:MAG: hypothetical protein D6785_06090, partial [Planctomycetota bacterium]
MSQNEQVRKAIENGPEDEFVVLTTKGASHYEYPASLLHIWLQLEDLTSFGIAREEVAHLLQPSMESRLDWLKKIAHFFQKKNILKESFKSTTHSHLFWPPEKFMIEPYIEVGSGQKARYSPYNLLKNLESFGIYGNDGEKGRPLPLGLVKIEGKGWDFREMYEKLQEVQSSLEQIGFSAILGKVEILASLEEEGKEILEIFLKRSQPPKVLLFFLPSPKLNNYEKDYLRKWQYKALEKGLVLHFVYEGQIKSEFFISNLVTAVLAKSGHLPYLLHEPIGSLDYLGGISLREREDRIWCHLRLFGSRGEFLKNVFYTAPKEELESLWERFLPPKSLVGEEILLFAPDSKDNESLQNLVEWAAKKDLQISLLSLQDWQIPRIYRVRQGKIHWAPLGTRF